MDLCVTSEAVEAIRSEAARADPRECCGILLGSRNRIERILPATNVHHAPATHFEIDPQTLIDAHRAAREAGPAVLGYYHSHPNGLSQPSATDRRLAAHYGAIWAIVAAGEVAFWRDGAQGFEPLSPVIAEA